MIKLPELDDQRYADIVEAAKRRIPIIYPEWTDFNEHDPGITIIELFAWLKEMQQYYLNRISDRSRENMLGLLGIKVREPVPSQTVVRFEDGEAPDRLIRGSTAEISDGTVFTALREFVRAPFRIGGVYVSNEDGFMDITDIAFENHTVFSPFGSSSEGSGISLYIKIDMISSDSFFDGFGLTFYIADNCPVKRNPFGRSGYSPRDVRWEYSSYGGFKECEIIADETRSLSLSGTLTLKTGRDFGSVQMNGLPEGKWIRGELTYCGCEDMPLVRMICTDILPLVQKKVYADFEDFILTGTSVTVSHCLAVQGKCLVFVRGEKGWIFAERAVVQKTEDAAEVELSEYSGLAANDGAPDVRVIYCSDYFREHRMFLSSNGLPCQSFPFDPEGYVLAEELGIMVLDAAETGSLCWREYEYVRSMALAGPYDRCFTYDISGHSIVFGDNEHGEAPPKGNGNIMIFSCSTTAGAGGNLPNGNISEVSDSQHSYSVVHSEDCSGGSDRETLHHAVQRMRNMLEECTRAVTAEDYRTVAMQTPGVRIADAAAIPFFDPEAPDAPKEKLSTTVSVVVLPYGDSAFPIPDKRFLAAVREHIENYRLVTTHVKISAPVYVRIDIFAEVVCGTDEIRQAKRHCEEALRSMLSVYGKDGRTKFGRPVVESEITACLCSLDGILSVRQVRLSSPDSGCRHDGYGRVVIPPHAIAYCGSVSIETTE